MDLEFFLNVNDQECERSVSGVRGVEMQVNGMRVLLFYFWSLIVTVSQPVCLKCQVVC